MEASAYRVTEEELDDMYNDETTVAGIEKALGTFMLLEQESQERALAQDSIYNKLHNISETLEACIDTLNYLLDAVAKTGDQFNVKKFERMDPNKPIKQSLLDSYKLKMYTIKKFVEKRITNKFQKDLTVSEVKRNILDLRHSFNLQSTTLRPSVNTFLRNILLLRKRELRRMGILLPYVYSREQYLKQVWIKNQLTLQHIEDIRTTLYKLRNIHRLIDDQRINQAKILKERIRMVEAEYSPVVDQIAIVAENRMILACIKTYSNKEHMVSKFNKSRDYYVDTEEKSLQRTREKITILYKREMNLAQWMERYDRDITPRYFKNEEIKAEMKIVVDKYTALRQIADEQEIIYNGHLHAKSFMFFDDHIYDFMRARVAKVIQAWFRRYGMAKWRIIEQERILAEAIAAALAEKNAKKKKKK